MGQWRDSAARLRRWAGTAVPWVALLLATSCGTPSTSADGCCGFDPVAFFEGRTYGEGVLAKGAGDVDRAFRVESVGRWEADTFLLEQVIVFSDGEQQRRTFELKREDGGRLVGTLSGVGRATLTQTGRRVSLSHRIKGLPLGRMTQSMYLVDDATLLNEGRVTSLGIEVRRLHEVIRRTDDMESRLTGQ